MESASQTPTPEAIRAQLAKITASQRFAGAPSLGRFLNFVVSEAIEGLGASLKEYLIGVDVFDRGEAFDPRIDPIVRVQAGKLRKRLQEFYAEEGAADEIIIDLQKGSYVPVFHERSTIARTASGAASVRSGSYLGRPAKTFWIPVAVTLALAAAAVTVWRFIPQSAARTSLGFTLSRLTTDSGQTTHPTVSPDGRLLAFSSDRGPQGDSNIWVQPLAGGEALQLTRDPAADTSPDFSPDGNHIVFRSWRDGGGIYVAPVLGGQQRRIAAGGYSPRFSADGKWVAYSKDGIHVAPSSGGDPFRVSGGVAGASCPLWTPDGKNVIFVGSAAKGYDWWAAPLDRSRQPYPTGVAAELRENGLKDFDETACPSDWMGNEVIFTLKVEGMGRLWKIPLSSQTWKASAPASQLIPGPGVDHARVLKLPGQSHRLVFATDTHLSNVWSLPVDVNQGRARGDIEQLTRDASLVGGLDGTRPVLSGDGERLVFPSSRSGNLDIWMKNLSTGKEEGLTGDPRPESQPVADVSAQTIAYQVSDGGRQSIYLINREKRMPRKLCEDCEYPMDMSPDGNLLLHRGDEPWGLNLLDLRTGKTITLLKDPGNLAVQASFSPGMNWIALVVRRGNREVLNAYAVPFDGEKIGAPDSWIPIAEEMFHLHLRWSPGGNLLYYFATRDDHRCLWAVRLDAATKRPIAPPQAVRHFHTVQHYPLSGSWISVARERLAFNLTDVTSNIWMVTIQ